MPGAYLGRGRGNAFLNDLCDADSLIHVVDASGRSDREATITIIVTIITISSIITIVIIIMKYY